MLRASACETDRDRFWVVALLVALAVAFDFMNGFHDAANSIATVVSTGVLKPQQAVVLAAFFNFVAIFVFHLNVAATIGKGIVDPASSTTTSSSARWSARSSGTSSPGTTAFPSSSSHALIGGIVGAAIAKAGTGSLIARRHLARRCCSSSSRRCSASCSARC